MLKSLTHKSHKTRLMQRRYLRGMEEVNKLLLKHGVIFPKDDGILGHWLRGIKSNDN
jgi:hypothetical protein